MCGGAMPTQMKLPMEGELPTPSMPVRGSKVFYCGEYELLEETGRDGLAGIYKARQISLNRLVALKMIGVEFLGERFYAEAEAMAMLDHPNILTVYERGKHEGYHFFSMQLVEGSNLSCEIEHYQQDLRAAARLVATVSRAVHHAHQRGILHRDIKPANILIDAKGEPHVTGFTLAKRMDLSDDDALYPFELLGTPAYMSPEQVQGLDLTTKADIWGLGATLYHLLTGRTPFRKETPLEMLRAVVEEAPARPRAANPRVDRQLEIICLKCLEKDPQQRYASAEALACDLEPWLDYIGAKDGGIPRGWLNRSWLRMKGKVHNAWAKRISSAPTP